MEDNKKYVTFSFSCLEHDSVNLKIRLRYDNLTQKMFFNSLLRMYVEGHPDMVRVVEQIKLSAGTMGRKKIYRARAEAEKGSTILSELGITETERESIFDMIEMNYEEGDYD